MKRFKRRAVQARIRRPQTLEGLTPYEFMCKFWTIVLERVIFNPMLHMPRLNRGQTHDVKNLFISDGSQFTTGGAENPTLTIVTLAIRQADYIADQMKKNAI